MNDHELDRDERALIDLARGHEDPSDAIRKRVHRATAARIAATVVVGTTVASTASTATAASAAATATGVSGALFKTLLLAGLAGLGTGAVIIATTPPPSTPLSARSAEVREPVRVEPSGSERRPTADAPPSAEVPDVAVPPESTVETPAAVPPTATSASARAKTAEPKAQESDALTDEVVLLQRAQRKLNSGDANGALELLAEHERNHERGALREERDAARVIALCKAGRRDEARVAMARFLRQSPDSPLASRVRAACNE